MNPNGTQLGGFESFKLPSNRPAPPKQDAKANENDYQYNGKNWN